MITFEEALARILDKIEPGLRDGGGNGAGHGGTRVVSVPLEKICGCVLAEPVVATMDMPAFDNSAVDGFGVMVADVSSAGEETPVKLSLQAVVKAGEAAALRLEQGKAIKILTGAPVARGVEAVVMREFVDEDNGHITISRSAERGENIRSRGGEFCRGTEILPAGTVANPAVVGLLATQGYAKFPTVAKPRVAIISTGDELVKPGRTLSAGQIYESNTHALKAAVQILGIENCLRFHARDNISETIGILKRALASSDVVITAGGVSVGDYDFVKDALESLGVQTDLWRIAIKPGKPVYFGVYEEAKGKRDNAQIRRKYVFGLPGNPVSALVTYHQLVKPALQKLMGLPASGGKKLHARLTKSVKKKPGRLEFLRGVLRYESDGPTVTPVVGQDSHMMSGLSVANALIYFPLEASGLNEGEQVLVELLDWSL